MMDCREGVLVDGGEEDMLIWCVRGCVSGCVSGCVDMVC